MERSLMEPTKESMILSAALSAMQGVETRVTTIESEMVGIKHQLEKELLINPAQALALRKAANKKVHEVLPDPAEYKAQRSKVYSALWGDFQTEFNISQYRELPRIKIEIAIIFIREWKYLYN